ncbi:MAG TPA: glycosyltransferase [Terriglobales bacterium]|nr:glycosyltransferase [Terriglobales bacterium]
MGYAVGQFNDSFPPLMDGVALVMWNYARWLNQSFGKCYAVVPDIPGTRGGSEARCDFPVLRYRSMPLFFRYPYRIGLPWIDRPFLRELHDLELDLVHSHNPFSAGVIARSYARKHGAPIVATFHSTIHKFVDGLLHSQKATRMIVGKVVDYYESVDSVWVSSKSTRDILKSYGYSREPEVIPHGTDLTPPRDAEAAAVAGDGVLGTAAADHVLLYVGFLSREKNLGFLIRALGQVKRMGIPFKMFLVGEGYARPELEKLARDLGLSDRLRFLGLIRDRRRLELCYARADLFTFPSTNETYSMVLREAAAFGVPSVVLEGTTAADVITDSRNGFVTEERVDAYAEKIAFLLTHPEEVEKAGRAAFQTLYTPWEAVMEKVARLYTGLIARGRT